jgi:hypothetical protein
MLIDHKTANMVVDETFRNLRLIKTSPGRDAVLLVYNNTVDGDGMRNLLGDYYVNAGQRRPPLKDNDPLAI